MKGAQSSANRRAIMIAMSVATLMIAQQIAGKAARDAFFLTNFPVSALPLVRVAAALLSIVVVLVASRLLLKYSPARAVPWIFVANGVVFGGEYVLCQVAQRVAAIVVYLHIAALGAVAISTFWSVVSDRFDPHTAKGAIARITMGATFGGVIGGLAAWQLSSRIPIQTYFIILAVSNLLCAGGIALLGGATRSESKSTSTVSGFRVLRETPYLQQLALLVTLGALGEAAVDFVFKSSAQIQYTSAGSLVTFFALFYTGTGVLSFALQSTVVGRMLRAVGLAGTVAMRPGVFVGGGLLALVFPKLWAATVLSASSQTVENSFYRSGYEILYTPLSAEKKRPTKTLVDVGFDKMGTAIGSGIVLILVAFVPQSSHAVLLGFAVAVGMLTLLVCTKLHTGYVGALADGLRSGAVRLNESDLIDRTSMLTLSQSTTALDREELLRQIAVLNEGRETGNEVPNKEVVAKSVSDPLVDAVIDLRSGDSSRILRRLRSEGSMTNELVGHVIPLLNQEEHAPAAMGALREIAVDAVGQLVDALLDQESPVVVRRRVTRLLSEVESQRALDGLMAALSDPVFDVRSRCFVAIDKLAQPGGILTVNRKNVFDSVGREAAAEDNVAAPRRLGHIANLLSLVLDSDVTQLGFRALQSGDEGLRGTGLEYLENVVPPSILTALQPLFDDLSRSTQSARSREELVDALLTSVDTQGIDIAAVRSHSLAKSSE